MIWTKLATFLLMCVGLCLMWLYKTLVRDTKDTKHDVGILDVIWTGPARWKTILNVAFLAVVAFFFPPEYMQAAGAAIGGPELGYGLPVIFGIASEYLMLKVFRKAMQVEGAEK